MISPVEYVSYSYLLTDISKHSVAKAEYAGRDVLNAKKRFACRQL